MKKYFLFLVCFISTLKVFSQAPESFKYQAVIRDANGEIMANEQVDLNISILQGSTRGEVVFAEFHDSTTNSYGIISLNVGQGNPEDFETIDWSNGPYFIKVDMNGHVMNISQLLSVPYANYANTAGNVFSGSYNDLTDIPENLDTDATDDFSGDYNDLLNTPNIQDSVLAILDTTSLFIRDELDGDPTNELQTISRSGQVVTLSHGGGSFIDSVNTYTAGSGIDITDQVISANINFNDKFYLGQDTLGGIVFHIYHGTDGQQHGLVVSKIESSNLHWQYSNVTVGASSTNNGAYNTSQMTDSPAKDWVINNFSNEWHIPSYDQLYLLFLSRFHVNKALRQASVPELATVYYWSSTEVDAAYAYALNFAAFVTNVSAKTANTAMVRAIKSF